jgi:hypothetical protein
MADVDLIPRRPVADEDSSLVDDDDIDINLRAPAIVAARVLVLAAVVRYTALLTPSMPRRPDDDVAAERFDLVSWLRLEGLSDDIALSEQRFLERETKTLDPDEIVAMSWRAESLVALGWALGLLHELAPPTTATDPSALLELIPRPYDATATFRTRPRSPASGNAPSCGTGGATSPICNPRHWPRSAGN